MPRFKNPQEKIMSDLKKAIVEHDKRVVPKTQKVARQICKLLEDILTTLGYGDTGVWIVSLRKQISKKDNCMFKVLRRKNRAILCRVKPGDNSTCWEAFLRPPQGLMLDQIYNDLAMVKPDATVTIAKNRLAKIQVPSKTTQSSIQNKETKMPNTQETSKPKQETNEPKVEKVEESQVLSIPKVEPSRLMIQAEAKQSIELPVAANAQRNSISPTPSNMPLAIPYNVKSANKDLLALDHGLIALAMGIPKTAGGYLAKKLGIQILIQELDLRSFVKYNSYYNSPMKVATTIIDGLEHNKRWVTRWKNATGTTLGYHLSPGGVQRIEDLKLSMPQELLNRINKPNLVKIKKTWRRSENESYYRRREEAKTANLSRDNTVKNIDNVPGSVQDIIKKARLSQDNINDIAANLLAYKSGLEINVQEAASLKEKLSKLQEEYDKIVSDIQAAETLLQEEEQTLELLKSSITNKLLNS